MALFEPLVLGKLILPNRFVMAPLTRCRAKLPGHVPTALMAQYYAQRASAGLIIAEATMVTEHGSAFYMEPGIHSAEQVAAWKATTAAVHDKGGRIFLQIWHGGRTCLPANNNNNSSQCVAPCDVAIPHRVAGHYTPTGNLIPYARCLADIEPPGIRDVLVAAAKNAMAAVAEATMVTEHGSAFYIEPEQVAAWRNATPYAQPRCLADSEQPDIRNAFVAAAKNAMAAIAGATVVTEHGSSFYMEPELHSAEQVAAWRHAIPYAQPRCLADSELPGIRDAFVAAAKNAMAAGFDGVELHCADGYLLDEFLRDGTNKRQPPYGGSLANRCRFPLEVIQSVCDATDSERVGVRISPLGSNNEMKDSDPVGLVTYLGNELNKLHIAYLHVIRGGMLGAQKGDVLAAARSAFKGTLIGSMGYTADEANAAIERKLVDAVAFGVPFISNPDLPIRVRAKLPLLPPKPEHFFSHGVEGYTDYPLCSAVH